MPVGVKQAFASGQQNSVAAQVDGGAGAGPGGAGGAGGAGGVPVVRSLMPFGPVEE